MKFYGVGCGKYKGGAIPLTPIPCHNRFTKIVRVPDNRDFRIWWKEHDVRCGHCGHEGHYDEITLEQFLDLEIKSKVPILEIET